MRALSCALMGLLLLSAKTTFGDEIVLPNTQKFQEYRDNEKRIQGEKIQVFVPLTMHATDSQAGVYQQILNHQLQQMQSYGLPMQNLQHWDGQLNVQRSSASTTTGAMSYQVQPITTQGSVNFQNVGNVSINHQMFLHQTEYRFNPWKSHWSYSHVDTTDDSTDRLMYGWEW